MKKIKTFLLLKTALILGLLVFLPSLALAQNTPSDNTKSLLDRLSTVGSAGGYNSEVTTPVIIGTVIGAFLGFLGIVFIVLIIISGFIWMTANGNEEKVKKSTTTIKNALIGIILALSSYSLWRFVFMRLIGLE
jgi:hypothetical protein